jgi:gluconolactonase
VKPKLACLISVNLFLTTTLAACGKSYSTPAANLPIESENSAEYSPISFSVTTSPVISETQSSRPVFDFTQPLIPFPVTGEYQYTEGPATANDGSVYFTDIDAGKVYRWSPDGSVSVFLQDLDKPNGTQFDSIGNLIVCEGGSGRLISIDPQGKNVVLIDQYNGVRFNEPNDLWIDPQGGIYFTDPVFQTQVVQDGQDVYYLLPDHSRVLRVISDLKKPNGIAGTPDGKTLYIADYGARQTFRFDINNDGSLSNKTLFVPIGSDGLKLDGAGNVYLTASNQVQIYSPAGVLLNKILLQEEPTNLTFAGKDDSTLFITARTAVYTVQMKTKLLTTTNILPTVSAFTLSSPDLPADGRLPAEYTCDGKASTLALTWSGAPEGTKSYAIIMHHFANPTDIHWYLVVYNIPSDVTSLPKNFSNIGILGVNSVNNRTEYAPPCSKGPGDKTYIYSIYALSADPQLSVPVSQVTRAVLLNTIENITLGSAQLVVVYARP